MKLLAYTVKAQERIPQEEDGDGVHYNPQDTVDLQAVMNENIL